MNDANFLQKGGIPRAPPALSGPLWCQCVIPSPYSSSGLAKHSPGHKSAVLQTALATLGFSEQVHFSTPLGTAPPFVGSFSHRFLLKSNFGNIIVQAQKQSSSLHHEWILAAEEPPQFLLWGQQSLYQNSNSLISRNVIPLPQRRGSPGSPLVSKSCRDTLGTHLDSVHHSMGIRRRCLSDRALEI